MNIFKIEAPLLTIENILLVDEKGFSKSLLLNFINSLIRCIFEARGGFRDYTEFFKIFYKLTMLHDNICYYMIKK